MVKQEDVRALKKLTNATDYKIKYIIKNHLSFSAVYILIRPDTHKVVYAGETKNFSQRMSFHKSHSGDSQLNTKLKQHPSYPQQVEDYFVHYRKMDNERERTFFEDFVKSNLKPPLNYT